MELVTARGVVPVRLEGELDAATAPQLAELLAAAVRPGDRVLVDMSAVGFLDCAALAEILRAHRRAAEQGGWVRLSLVQDEPMLVLELTGSTALLRHGIPSQRPPVL